MQGMAPRQGEQLGLRGRENITQSGGGVRPADKVAGMSCSLGLNPRGRHRICHTVWPLRFLLGVGGGGGGGGRGHRSGTLDRFRVPAPEGRVRAPTHETVESGEFFPLDASQLC